MSASAPESPDETIRDAAARWTVRRDRGLSAAESIDFELWLAADPRHAAAMRRASAAWSRLDHLPENAATPVLAAAARHRSFWRRSFVVGSLAAAAAVALVALRLTRAPATSAAPAGDPRQLVLSDGTLVHLNTGGEIVEQFTAVERRVLLAHGEAHFAVTKNPALPFVVRAGNVDVRAVGTAFNVNLRSAAVEVLVTEGIVQLNESAEPVLAAASAASRPDGPPRNESSPRDHASAGPASGRPTVLNANERAVVSLAAVAPSAPAPAVVVSTATPDEIARTLAWQAPLLRLGGATLAELVLEFQRRSGQRVILADPALASLRVGGRFRADDLEGFTHLLATTLDLEADRAADGALVLRRKKLGSR